MFFPSCDQLPFDHESLVNILRVELTVHDIEIGAPSSPDTAFLFFEVSDCGGDVDSVTIRVQHYLTGQSIAQTLDIDQSSPEILSRILALSMAELIRSSWVDLLPGVGVVESSPNGSGGASGNRASDGFGEAEGDREIEAEEDRLGDEPPTQFQDTSVGSPRPASSPEAHRFRATVDVAIDVRGFIGYGGAQFGGRAGASLPLGRSQLQIGIDVGGWYGVAFDPLGSVDIIAASAGLSLLWTNGRRDLNAGIGPRIEIGWGRGAGRPDDPSVAWGEHFDAFLSIITMRAVMRVAIGRQVLLLVDLQGGYVISGLEARAADRRAAGIGGPVIVLGLGVSIDPSRRESRTQGAVEAGQ